MSDQTDLYVGKRIRRRRRLLGMTQQDLASLVGVRFQQIQKYECGANRITSSRLFDLARALRVTVQYFFEGLDMADQGHFISPETGLISEDSLGQNETRDLVRTYSRLGESARLRLLELARGLELEGAMSHTD